MTTDGGRCGGSVSKDIDMLARCFPELDKSGFSLGNETPWSRIHKEIFS